MESGNDPQTVICPLCGKPAPYASLSEVGWLPLDVKERMLRSNPGWSLERNACSRCVVDAVLHQLIDGTDRDASGATENTWALTAEKQFGPLPTPLRLHSDPRYTGAGVTIVMIDSGFYPHPDLVQPRNRIRAAVDAGLEDVPYGAFGSEETPRVPGWDDAHPSKWHGMMTTTVAAGNGYLSKGAYRGLASDADLVLIRARQPDGHISNESITRALRWVAQHREEFGVRVVSMSVSGDMVEHLAGNPVDEAVRELVEQGVCVVAAAGNDGARRLVPPATSPHAITVGGLDDRNIYELSDVALWHSNYGESSTGVPKPELVAPSIWVVAPVLPGSDTASEALYLFEARKRGDLSVEGRIAELKLVTPYYQHVEGTSFATPIVASTIACMIEADPDLTPAEIRTILIESTYPVPGAPRERQGFGALDPGQAIYRVVRRKHGAAGSPRMSPHVTPQGITFILQDDNARGVSVMGSWDNWQVPGVIAEQREPSIWYAQLPPLRPGIYAYGFVVDGERWVDDPANPYRISAGTGSMNSVLEA